MTIKDYPYLYETHLHTVPGSACAHNTGAEMAEAALKKGYAGIIVTDHNWGGNTGINRALPWEQWVDGFIQGYLDALEFGKKHDFDVFWGYEAGFHATEFLIYGITPEWLKQHPEIRTGSKGSMRPILPAKVSVITARITTKKRFFTPARTSFR